MFSKVPKQWPVWSLQCHITWCLCIINYIQKNTLFKICQVMRLGNTGLDWEDPRRAADSQELGVVWLRNRLTMAVISWAQRRGETTDSQGSMCVCLVRRWYCAVLSWRYTHIRITAADKPASASHVSTHLWAQIPSQHTPTRPTGKYNSIYSVTSLFISKEMHSGPVICIKINCDNWHRIFKKIWAWMCDAAARVLQRVSTPPY